MLNIPTFDLSDKLYVYDPSKEADKDLRLAYAITARSLQGIVAQKIAAQVYVATANDHLWLDQLCSKYSMTRINVENIYDLINMYKNIINGYIRIELSDKDDDSNKMNYAFTACGIEALIVVPSIIEKSFNEACRIKLVIDTADGGTYTYYDAFLKYKDHGLNKNLLIQQRPTNINLREYAAAAKALCYYEPHARVPVSARRDEVYDWINDNSPCMGWAEGWEDNFVGYAANHGLFTIPADHCENLSIFASLPHNPLHQKKTRKNADYTPENSGKYHYVTLIMSDGDNVQYYENLLAPSKDHISGSDIGRYPLGWTMPPMLGDYFNNIMEYCYDTVNDNNHFIAGVSGLGYTYPDEIKPEAFDNFTNLTGEYMEKYGMQYVAVMTALPFRQDIIDGYAKQDAIKAGFIYSAHIKEWKGGEGKILWSHGKPFVSLRESVWVDSYETVVDRVNHAPIDKYDESGYSAINISCCDGVKKVYEKFAEKIDTSRVKLVTPDEFLELIKINLHK